MPLPDLIEIVPLREPVEARVAVPGSKSITNRALVLAALGEGEATLRGALWSEDTQVMVECLQDLGFMVNVGPDPEDPCNRTLTVYGQGGTVPRGGTPQQPLELFVGNAGTAARFLAAMVCLGSGVYRLHGVPRMHERPQAALLGALGQLGYRVEAENDRLPALIHGGGPRTGRCEVAISGSSQFASALLLSAARGGWQVAVTGENSEESPYVAMTSKLIEVFPRSGGEFRIEPDASSGSYFWAADFAQGWRETGDWRLETGGGRLEAGGCRLETCAGQGISVNHWPTSGWQIDQQFVSWLGRLWELSGPLKPAVGEFLTISRSTDLGDSIMTAIVIAPWLAEPVRFTDLGRLRVQECERVAALRRELTRCGARVEEHGDTLAVYPSPGLHGAEIETYDDHRMAMCFGVFGLRVPGVRIRNPRCVRKTFPNFFQKLAARPPAGLGARILDARTGLDLSADELFAE